MITETGYTYTHTSEVSDRHSRRRHHTLDNGTLDQFNFICIPLHPTEVKYLH